MPTDFENNCSQHFLTISMCIKLRGADRSLARPGKKQAWKHVRDACDFNNIEMQAVIKSLPPLPARQGARGNSCHSERNIS